MEITQTQSKPTDYGYMRTWIAVALTLSIILMVMCSFPSGVAVNDVNATNYRIAKALCFNNTISDSGDNIVYSSTFDGVTTNITLENYISNVTRTWNESTQTCWCDRYYLPVNEYNYSCNLTYWFMPHDGVFTDFNYSPVKIYWCYDIVNCTRQKFRLGKFDINGNK